MAAGKDRHLMGEDGRKHEASTPQGFDSPAHHQPKGK